MSELIGQAPKDLVELGRIVSAYGVKGWVKVQPYSTQSQVLLSLPVWWLQAPVPVGKQGAFSRAQKQAVAWPVQASRQHAGSVVAQFEMQLDRDQAQGLKGYTVWASRSTFPEPDNDEYYWVDLVGCRVFGEQDGEAVLLGEVAQVTDNGAHAVLQVMRANEAQDGQLEWLHNDKGRILEVLVPFVKSHVHTVDLKNKRIESNWPADW